MRPPSFSTDAQQIDWAYEGRRPWIVLKRLLNERFSFYLGAAFVCTVKHSPLWFLAILPAKVIDSLVHPSAAGREVLVILTTATVVLLVLNIPAHTLFVKLFSDTTRALEQRLRLAVTQRVQQLSLACTGAVESGRIQAKMLRDVEQVHLMAMELGVTGLAALVQLLFVVVFIGSSRPAMLLCFVLITPAAVIVARLLHDAIQSRNASYRRNLESMNNQVVGMMGMLAMARAHGIEETAISDISERVSEVNKHGKRLDRINAIFTASNWVTFQFFGLGVLGVGAWFAIRGWMSAGDIILYTALFAQLVAAINQILNLYPLAARGMESMQSLKEALQLPDLEHNEGRSPAGCVRGEIRFESVSFTYPGSLQPAVCDLDLRIPEGRTVAIVGASGSGKSTLVNLAIGFSRPSVGRILLDGVDMETIDMRTWRQHLSLVPQQIALFNGTIRENILFGLPRVEPGFFEKVVALTHVEDFVSKLPEGYETPLGEGGARLSGGQKQRLAIARALIRDPKVIVLDEPTSALDLESEKLIQQALEELTRGRTTLIVAHRLSTIRHADLVCVLEEGRLVEMGSHQELIALDGAYSGLHAAAGFPA